MAIYRLKTIMQLLKSENYGKDGLFSRAKVPMKGTSR